jgi:lysophospholipase L1-like esterase
MSQDQQTKFPCLKRAAMATAFFALHSVALHTAAFAQMQMPAHFVAPEFAQVGADVTPVAAPAATPTAVPAVVTSRAATNVIKPAVVPPAAFAAAAPPASCNAPLALTHLDRPLLHTMRRLANGAPLTIVAIGSSSTAGAGATSAAASYPNQLAADLRARFPGHDITVLNRGVNGEETDNMMARFAKDVIAENPQLVIWQVGTNSVLRDRSLEQHAAQLHDGIAQLKAIDADVVLMDLQYSPAVIAKSETEDMVEQIALAAKTENVDLFERFAIMRDWSEVQHLSFDAFVAPDHLHMNDWGYGCVAKLLAGAIAEAATRPITSAAAHAAPGSAPAKPAAQ